MSREKELFKNTIILGLGNFLPKLVGVITLPIITACLTEMEYGTYDLIQTLLALLIPVATLQIHSAAFRFLIDCRGDKVRSSEIITNISVVTCISASLSAVLVGLGSYKLSTGVRFAVALCFFAETINVSVSQIVRGLSKNKLYSICSVLSAVVNGVGIVVLLLVTHQGLLGSIIAIAAGNIAGAAVEIAVVKLPQYIHLKYLSHETIKEIISYSWPMIPNNLSTWILKMSDRLVITAFLGLEANAVYAVANKIPNLLSIAQGVLVMAWQENASIAVKDVDAESYYSSMFERIFSFLVGCTSVLIGFTPLMFALLIKGDYSDAYIQMPILILGMFFCAISSFQGGIYIAHKKTKSVGMTTLCAAAINLAIDLLFVKTWGITAGSVSTLVAYLALYIYRLKGCLKFQKVNYNIKRQIMLIAILMVQLCVCALKSVPLDVINVVIGILVFMLLNRRLIAGIINNLG